MAKKKIILMKVNGKMDKWRVKESSLILLESMKEMLKQERDKEMESIISLTVTTMKDNGLITTKKVKENSSIKKEEISILDSSVKASSMVMVNITTKHLASSILVNKTKNNLILIISNINGVVYSQYFICFTGEWDNDQWSGLGKFLDADHKVIKCGVWKNDKLESAKDEKDVVFPENLKHLLIKVEKPVAEVPAQQAPADAAH